MISVLRLVVADLLEFLRMEIQAWRTPAPAESTHIEALPAAAPALAVEESAPTFVHIGSLLPKEPYTAASSQEVAEDLPGSASPGVSQSLTLPARQMSVLPEAALLPPALPTVTVPDYSEPQPEVQSESAAPLHYPSHMYVCVSPQTFLWKEAHVDFDTALLPVSYGQVVSVRAFIGAYAEVLVFGQVGYIHKDELAAKKEDVWPTLEARRVYGPDTPATLLTRRLLTDPFMAGRLSLPLQAGEYILLRLKQDGLSISWPVGVRPRLPGGWHRILRGIRGIHTSVMPLTDSVMEWTLDDGEGRLAYVEAVLPDKTLRLTGVGIQEAGAYSELVLGESEWREWRPVFIEVA